MCKMVGEEVYDLTGRLFPIYRHLMGDGVRETLRIVQEYLPGLSILEIPSGEHVYDWTVPEEWFVREAYIENRQGDRIIDLADNNLHVVAYSGPIDEWMDLERLKEYVFVSDEQPDAVPYVTSYYKDTVGMCMSKRQLESLGGGSTIWSYGAGRGKGA